MISKQWIWLLALVLLAAGCSTAWAAGDFSDAFPEKFLAEGEEPVVTDWSYRSHNISIEITPQRVERADVYVADIYVRSLACFQRVYAYGVWDKNRDRVDSLAAASGAILAMTGDSSEYFEYGWVAGNGEIWRDSTNTKRDLGVLYKDGVMAAYRLPSREIHQYLKENRDNIWQTFLFGPALLDEEGKAYPKFDSNVNVANPRSVVGYYEPGHYCFVQVDGRSTTGALEAHTSNKGLDLKQLAQLMESLGCKAAYNLDGGRSSMMWFVDDIISTPASRGRTIGDIVVIREME